MLKVCTTGRGKRNSLCTAERPYYHSKKTDGPAKGSEKTTEMDGREGPRKGLIGTSLQHDHVGPRSHGLQKAGGSLTVLDSTWGLRSRN